MIDTNIEGADAEDNRLNSLSMTAEKLHAPS
jgi:hypothetical protein